MPAGESAFGLVSEAISFLGSPDTDWRDEIGYGVVATCVYEKRALMADERRTLVHQLSATLRRGLHVLLSLPAPGTSGQAVAAAAGELASREKVLAILAGIRR